MLIGKTERDISALAELFIDKNILEENTKKKKSKYKNIIILLWKNYNRRNFAVNEMLFERVNTFEYIIVELTGNE